MQAVRRETPVEIPLLFAGKHIGVSLNPELGIRMLRPSGRNHGPECVLAAAPQDNRHVAVGLINQQHAGSAPCANTLRTGRMVVFR
ncbi:hypothetical protein D9M68_966390 [compost metagenome]